MPLLVTFLLVPVTALVNGKNENAGIWWSRVLERRSFWTSAEKEDEGRGLALPPLPELGALKMSSYWERGNLVPGEESAQ